MSNFVAKLSIKEKEKPKIFKCKQVPLAYNVATNKAIDDLVEQGFIEPVQHNDWASPIVPILKKNKEICADFWYVNSQINVEKFPLPTYDEMINIVDNNTIFSSIDLENAYLQLPIESSDLLVITPNKGLFR